VGSLNVKQADAELFQLVHAVGQQEVTFAPETVEELRPSLGKAYITDEKLLELAHLAGRFGLDLNIYSLGSLPGETDRHTRAFASLIRSLRQAQGDSGTVYVHYNPAFMKAQTPYEYLGNTRPAEARRKYRILRGELEGLAGVEYVSVIEDPMLFYQPVLALGDYNASRVLQRLLAVAQPGEDDWQRAFADLAQGSDPPTALGAHRLRGPREDEETGRGADEARAHAHRRRLPRFRADRCPGSAPSDPLTPPGRPRPATRPTPPSRRRSPPAAGPRSLSSGSARPGSRSAGSASWRRQRRRRPAALSSTPERRWSGRCARSIEP